jgi:hypothetical protein
LISFPLNEEIAGINFSRLLQKRPQLGPEITQLRAQLQELETIETGKVTEMQVWKMKDLGLQTLQAMNKIEHQTEAVDKLIDIVQNFPSRASALSAVKVSPALRDQVEK